MKISFKFDNVREFKAALEDAKRKRIRAGGDALYDEAHDIIRDALPITPIDTGFLRASNFVDPPEFANALAWVLLGYTAPYALEVHETPKNYRVGDYKFLERTVKEHSKGFDTRIAGGIDKRV